MSEDRDLVILTQNIWGGVALWERRRTMLARLIGDLRPGIIGLQEVPEAPDPWISNSGGACRGPS